MPGALSRCSPNYAPSRTKEPQIYPDVTDIRWHSWTIQTSKSCLAFNRLRSLLPNSYTLACCRQGGWDAAIVLNMESIYSFLLILPLPGRNGCNARCCNSRYDNCH